MKNILFKLFQVTSIFFSASFIIFSGSFIAEAKSATVTSSSAPNLVVPHLEGPGGRRAINLDSGIIASIRYGAEIINVQTGALISDGDVVPVGTDIKLRDGGLSSTDISWNFTGGDFDTPYGYWIDDAGPPSVSCNSGDEVQDPMLNDCPWCKSLGSKVFLPFSVNPYRVSRFLGGAAQLKCTDNQNTDCKIISGGTIKITFRFTSTYGKLYPQMSTSKNAYGIPTGCHVSSFPFRQDRYNGAPYQWDFSPTSIDFNFSAVTRIPSNNPPTIYITHNSPNNPPNPVTGEDVTFNFTGQDPDTGDRLTYQIDWTNGTSRIFNEVLPVSGDVAPGTTISAPKSWATPGIKRIWAKAVDNNMAFSSWEYHEITVDAPPPPPATPTITLTDSGCSGTQPYIKLDWATSLGATKYYIDRNAFEIGSTNGLLTYQDSTVTNSTLYSYSVRAEGPTGTSGSSASVSVTALNCAPPPPVCGNGNIEGIEQCDGTNFGADSCQARGFSQGSLSCGPSSSPSPCIINSSDCRNPAPAVVSSCGNGILNTNTNEECDKGTANGNGTSGCSSSCQKTYICGNGKCEKTLKENFNNCPKDCKAGIKETMAPRVNFLAWLGNFFSFWFK